MTPQETLNAHLIRTRRLALIVGGVALAACILGGVVAPAAFFHAYLYAFLFWFGIALGSLGVLMMHHITGGAWGFTVRRLLEAATMTLPLLALLFIPLLFGLRFLYPWAQPETVAADPILQHRQALYTPGWFAVRALLYFAVWLGLALTLRSWSLEQDRTADPVYTQRFQLTCGPGLVLFGFTVSFAVTDWLMSLEAHWYSTIFGMLLIVGQALSALAFAIVFAQSLAGRRLLTQAAPPSAWQDTGGMLIAFVLLWAYLAYSQYIIIWSGDLPPEISFYLHRRAGAWHYVAFWMVITHFFLPFFLLLFGTLKRNTRSLALIALLLLASHLLDTFWLVAPSFHPQGLWVTWLDGVMPFAIGGLWLGLFAGALHGKPLLPLHDPRLQTSAAAIHAEEALQHGR